ncbi:hypothetical protein DFJ74DRAFT_258708 [Hyaloraphidium curvatum]|nr:hypothetical protein DFJ74DRAFT_258708 [Hyaloraphidium curvatum]
MPKAELDVAQGRLQWKLLNPSDLVGSGNRDLAASGNPPVDVNRWMQRCISPAESVLWWRFDVGGLTAAVVVRPAGSERSLRLASCWSSNRARPFLAMERRPRRKYDPSSLTQCLGYGTRVYCARPRPSPSLPAEVVRLILSFVAPPCTIDADSHRSAGCRCGASRHLFVPLLGVNKHFFTWAVDLIWRHLDLEVLFACARKGDFSISRALRSPRTNDYAGAVRRIALRCDDLLAPLVDDLGTDARFASTLEELLGRVADNVPTFKNLIGLEFCGKQLEPYAAALSLDQHISRMTRGARELPIAHFYSALAVDHSALLAALPAWEETLVSLYLDLPQPVLRNTRELCLKVPSSVRLLCLPAFPVNRGDLTVLLSRLSKVEVLRLYIECQLGAEDVDALRISVAGLREVSLFFMPLADSLSLCRPPPGFFAALRSNSLRILGIAGLSLDAEDARDLSSTLQANESLKSLTFAHTQLDSTVIEWLSLPETLTTLYLNTCGLESTLPALLSQVPDLKRLGLSGEVIRSASWGAISQLHGLSSLEVAGSRYRLFQLEDTVFAMKSLTRLRFSGFHTDHSYLMEELGLVRPSLQLLFEKADYDVEEGFASEDASVAGSDGWDDDAGSEVLGDWHVDGDGSSSDSSSDGGQPDPALLGPGQPYPSIPGITVLELTDLETDGLGEPSETDSSEDGSASDVLDDLSRDASEAIRDRFDAATREEDGDVLGFEDYPDESAGSDEGRAHFSDVDGRDDIFYGYEAETALRDYDEDEDEDDGLFF